MKRTDDQTLWLYLSGELPPEETSDWEARMDREPGLDRRCSEARETFARVRELPPLTPSRDLVQAALARGPRSAAWGRRMAWAAGTVAALLAVWAGVWSPAPRQAGPPVVGQADAPPEILHPAVLTARIDSVRTRVTALRRSTRAGAAQWNRLGARSSAVHRRIDRAHERLQNLRKKIPEVRDTPEHTLNINQRRLA